MCVSTVFKAKTEKTKNENENFAACALVHAAGAPKNLHLDF